MAIRTVFFGTPSFAVPILKMLAQRNDMEVVLVVTQPDTAVGRKQIMTAPPIKQLAQKYNIPCYQPHSLKTPEAQAEILKVQPELIVLAAYGKIIPKTILDLPRLKCLNIHPSALPMYRGATPIQSVILNGENQTATSVMIMEPTLDTGPIVIQKSVTIAPHITYPELDAQLAQISAALLGSVLADWIAGTITPQIQDDTQATYTKVLQKEDGKINWLQNAVHIDCQIRAFTPWPGTFSSYNGKRVKILSAKPTHAQLSPGEISFQNENMLIGCGENTALAIELLQEEGKQPMTIAQFKPGHLHWQGAKLV